MNSPFPGMNPYLESNIFWSEVHHRLITAIADAIEVNIPPQYRVAIEQRTYLSDDSDVSVFSQKEKLPKYSSRIKAVIENSINNIKSNLTFTQLYKKDFTAIAL
jgi:hypothetical protein